MSLWGLKGPEVVWGFHQGLTVGQSCDVVADIVSSTDDSVLAPLYPSGQGAKFIGQVPGDCCSSLVETGPILCFVVDRAEDVLCHQRCCRKKFNNLIEFCCGMGIGMFRFDMCGFETVCAVDWSEPLLKAHTPRCI